jgi:hypothetical protein
MNSDLLANLLNSFKRRDAGFLERHGFVKYLLLIASADEP